MTTKISIEDRVTDALSQSQHSESLGKSTHERVCELCEDIDRQARIEEREACAKIAENPYSDAVRCKNGDSPLVVGGCIAHAIRARAEPNPIPATFDFLTAVKLAKDGRKVRSVKWADEEVYCEPGGDDDGNYLVRDNGRYVTISIDTYLGPWELYREPPEKVTLWAGLTIDAAFGIVVEQCSRICRQSSTDPVFILEEDDGDLWKLASTDPATIRAVKGK